MLDPEKENKLTSFMKIALAQSYTNRPPLYPKQPAVPAVHGDPIEKTRTPVSALPQTPVQPAAAAVSPPFNLPPEIKRKLATADKKRLQELLAKHNPKEIHQLEIILNLAQP